MLAQLHQVYTVYFLKFGTFENISAQIGEASFSVESPLTARGRKIQSKRKLSTREQQIAVNFTEIKHLLKLIVT